MTASPGTVLGAPRQYTEKPEVIDRLPLIRPEEADAAKIEIIHREISIFSTEWFNLQVTDGSFSVECKDPSTD
jgi:hypothetical protein